jgi:hypothetical protein
MSKIINGLIAGLLLATGQTANASYIVIDDDLLPANMTGSNQVYVSSSAAASSSEESTPISIPFGKWRSQLGKQGVSAIKAVLPQIRGKTVRIVGKLDGIVYENHLELADLRANEIKTYLIARGIPANDITIDTDKTPNKVTKSGTYDSTIYISDKRPVQAYEQGHEQEPPQSQTHPQIQSQAIESTIAPLTAAEKASRTKVIAMISQLAVTGEIDSMAAIKMIQALTAMDQRTQIKQQEARIVKQKPDGRSDNQVQGEFVIDRGN